MTMMNVYDPEEYYQRLMLQASMYHNFNGLACGAAPPTGVLQCSAELLNQQLWRQFHELGTEMIITKTGRRMFPPLSVQLGGLEPGARYAVSLELWTLGSGRWRRQGGSWTEVCGRSSSGTAPPASAPHPDSPAPAERWTQPFTFKHVKLTNNLNDQAGNIVLTSMFKYQPRVRVVRLPGGAGGVPGEGPGGHWLQEKVFTFPETEFIAVTAYQNENITKLKIDNNPFAKGFREHSQGRCKRKCGSPSGSPKPSKARREDSNTQPQDLSCHRLDERLSSRASDDSSIRSTSTPVSSSSCSPRHEAEPTPIALFSAEEIRFLQFREWAWGLSHALAPPCFPPPCRQCPPAPQHPCRIAPHIKGSSFTIRALIGEH